MIWLRMLWVALRLSWPHPFAPWRSPLLRWRIETYGLRGADGRMLAGQSIDRRTFIRFCLTERRALLKFLRWAAELPSASPADPKRLD